MDALKRATYCALRARAQESYVGEPRGERMMRSCTQLSSLRVCVCVCMSGPAPLTMIDCIVDIHRLSRHANIYPHASLCEYCARIYIGIYSSLSTTTRKLFLFCFFREKRVLPVMHSVIHVWRKELWHIFLCLHSARGSRWWHRTWTARRAAHTINKPAHAMLFYFLARCTPLFFFCCSGAKRALTVRQLY